jgi:hypothetical protein
MKIVDIYRQYWVQNFIRNGPLMKVKQYRYRPGGAQRVPGI